MTESDFPKFPEYSNTAQQFKIVALHFAIKFMRGENNSTGMIDGSDVDRTVKAAKKFEEYILDWSK